MPDNKPRVSRVVVSNLFGLYHHDVSLNLEQRITILHGQNGVGKTVLLHLIAALFNGNYLEMMKVPFDDFTVTLDDGLSVNITRQNIKTNGRPAPMLLFAITKRGTIVDTYVLNVAACFAAASRIPQDFPFLIRDEFDSWIDESHSNSVPLSTMALVARWRDRLSEQTRAAFPTEPESLVKFRDSVEITLIEAQRLLKITRQTEQSQIYSRNVAPRINTAVKTIAQDLKAEIAITLTRYASESQKLDQQFPRRLLGEQAAPLSSDILKEKFQRLEQRLEDFRVNGLVEEAMVPLNLESLDDLEETQRRAMSIYVENTEKKLDVLKGLSQRMDLLLAIVRDKFRHKRIAVQKEKGLVALDETGHELDLNQLSSGEQHELVMTYDLLFKVSKNSLVLIDEPELSLHLTWQKAFLPDLKSIVATSEFDVILATHSPFIVGDSNDLMIELSSGEERS